jgi:hypothetical protein
MPEHVLPPLFIYVFIIFVLLFIYLIYGLFNDAVSSSDYIALSEMIINE